LKKAAENPAKVKQDDLIQLRRLIYQSMQLSFQRGKLVSNAFAKAFEPSPNLEIIPKVSAAYEQAMDEDVKNRDHISTAHRNFLRDAVYFLYQYNRVADAAKWYRYLGEKYPNKYVIDGNTNSLPRQFPLEDYCVSRTTEDMDETDPVRVQAAIEGQSVRAYEALITGQNELYAGYRLLSRKLWEKYTSKIKSKGDPAEGPERTRIRSVEETENEVLKALLNPDTGMPFDMRAALRYQLGMPPEAAPATTNSPPAITAPSVTPGR
jgi:hypothetical protein